MHYPVNFCGATLKWEILCESCTVKLKSEETIWSTLDTFQVHIDGLHFEYTIVYL